MILVPQDLVVSRSIKSTAKAKSRRTLRRNADRIKSILLNRLPVSTKPNIRNVLMRSPNYWEINCEERNYAAILFAALCKPGNAERFLNRFCANFSGSLGPEFGIYFEYAYLRHLWGTLRSNEQRKAVVRSLLGVTGIEEILAEPLVEINKRFGILKNPSRDWLQSPGSWIVNNLAEHFPSNDDFLKVCKFKWSFNIKPDIVIHLDKEHAICLEAKFKSCEGSYPADKQEKELFDDRRIMRVGQLELQKYMMEDLLGVQTQFVLLAAKTTKTLANCKFLSWKNAFEDLDLGEMPRFALEMVNQICA